MLSLLTASLDLHAPRLAGGRIISSRNSYSRLNSLRSRYRNMATVREDSIPHVVRTAADRRQRDMFSATIGRIEQVNSTIRLLRLYLDDDQVGA